MPILKIPVVHKFGIISHCQRLQLQSRFVSDLHLEKLTDIESTVKRNSIEITDDFVDQYNSVIKSVDIVAADKEHMRAAADKIFLKNKRRIGLQHNCENESHINVALGWTELVILSQCHGDVSDKSLNLICLSLSVAPLSPSTFLVQFYLLEIALYFLQTVEFQPNHPENHIKWLQIGELAALRIYVQCKLRLSQCPTANLDNLQMYMKDIGKCQKNFEIYPEAAISFCVLHELTEYLTTIVDTSGAMVEAETLEHDKNSLLWHSVDLWRCSFYSAHRPQIPEAVNGLRNCLMQNNTAFGNWIDCYTAIRVLACAASFEKVGLDVFGSLLLGLVEINEVMEQREQQNPNQPEELSSTNIRICGFEKGTLLLFTGFREFSCIPLFSRKSAERERSLSTIAEWVLQKSFIRLPKTVEKIITSRLKALLTIVELSEKDSIYFVMKNSIWSLLEAIQRKQTLQGELQNLLKYGSIISSTLFSIEFAPFPILLNERLSMAISNHIFSPRPTLRAEEFKFKNHSPRKNTTRKNEISNDRNIKYEIHSITKKSKTKKNKSSDYSQQFDSQLNKILQNLWVADLPVLEKTIDEEND